MTRILGEIKALLPDVYRSAQFNPDDLFAMLQGITGYVSAIVSRDPFAVISSALDMAYSQTKRGCLKSLESSRDIIRKGLAFGKNYKPLEDSSELDFDDLDVSSVPEIMQVSTLLLKEQYHDFGMISRGSRTCLDLRKPNNNGLILENISTNDKNSLGSEGG